LKVDPRVSRQARLVEVGETGQARLEHAFVMHASRTGGALAARVERRYLRGAGLQVNPDEAHVALEEDLAPGSLPAWLGALEPGARDVGAGALSALSVIRAVLAGEPHPRVRASEA
jgi:hypothetical protein